MNYIDRILVAALATGLWTLVALQIVSNTAAFAQTELRQAGAATDGSTPQQSSILNATEIVGLDAQIAKALREQQIRPQAISGLDQHIKSIVRNCRVNGGTSGGRITYASISC